MKAVNWCDLKWWERLLVVPVAIGSMVVVAVLLMTCPVWMFILFIIELIKSFFDGADEDER